MKHPVSVVIITRDEEDAIGRCLAAVEWADEVLVVDSGSADKTVEICRRSGCRVIERAGWEGFGAQKRFAVSEAAHDWILSVDADEVVSPALAGAVRAVLAKPAYDGYRIRRCSFYIGKPVRHCGWNRDYPLRLFDRRQGNFNTRNVHESVRLPGEKGILQEPLYHYTYPTAASHYRKMAQYAQLGAERLASRGERPYPGQAAVHAAAKFIKMFLLQAGFLDGSTGLLLSARSAYGVYLKYRRLWQLTR